MTIRAHGQIGQTAALEPRTSWPTFNYRSERCLQALIMYNKAIKGALEHCRSTVACSLQVNCTIIHNAVITQHPMTGSACVHYFHCPAIHSSLRVRMKSKFATQWPTAHTFYSSPRWGRMGTNRNFLSARNNWRNGFETVCGRRCSISLGLSILGGLGVESLRS